MGHLYDSKVEILSGKPIANSGPHPCPSCGSTGLHRPECRIDEVELLRDDEVSHEV